MQVLCDGLAVQPRRSNEAYLCIQYHTTPLAWPRRASARDNGSIHLTHRKHRAHEIKSACVRSVRILPRCLGSFFCCSSFFFQIDVLFHISFNTFSFLSPSSQTIEAWLASKKACAGRVARNRCPQERVARIRCPQERVARNRCPRDHVLHVEC